MSYENSELANAFPRSLRDDVLKVISALPQPLWNTNMFSASICGEMAFIPYRVYHDPALIDLICPTALQIELLDCLLTRHHDGFVREKHLTKIVCTNHPWVPPFVVQLVGEYVIEIVHVIQKNVDNLDPQLYRGFLLENPTFWALTKQRVISYWNCYYRGQCREDYPGFKVLEFLERLIEHPPV